MIQDIHYGAEDILMLWCHRNTLTSQDLVDYMAQHNILVWAGNVRETEAFQGKNKVPCFFFQLH